MNYVTDDELNIYLRTIQPKYKGNLGEIQKKANELNIPIIPHETARFLSVLMTLKKPKHILEIGTAVGFSASLMAQYIPEDGSITTIDRFDIMIQNAKKNIEKMELKNKIKILEGDANDILPTLNNKYDVIFIDAAKGQYGKFFKHCIRLLPIGGIIIFDDVLQGGNISRSRFEVPRRQRTIHKRMRNFLWEISHSDLFESSIIPIGDGIVLCIKIKEIEN